MRKSLPGGLGGIKMPSERGSPGMSSLSAVDEHIRAYLRLPRFTQGVWRPLPGAEWRKGAWENSVREGRTAPDRAEEFAFVTGQPPFVRVTEEDRLAVRATHWPLTLAIFWRAWDDVDLTARAWADFRFWGDHVWRNAKRPDQKMTLLEAKHTLKEDLISGSIKATGLCRGDRQEISGYFWIDAKWKEQGSHIEIGSSNGIPYMDLAILQKYLTFNADKAPSGHSEQKMIATDAVSSTKGPGGRPKVHDWDAMWIEVCRRIHENGVPERASLLREAMQLWFTERGLKEPSDTEMKPRFSALFKALGRKAD